LGEWENTLKKESDLFLTQEEGDLDDDFYQPTAAEP